MRTYLLHLTTQIAGMAALIFVFGATDDAELYFKNNRTLVFAMLVVHFVMYFISALAEIEKHRIEEFRNAVLEKDE